MSSNYQVTKSACVRCHFRKPRTEMQQVEESSTHFSGFSVGLGKKNFGPRLYFRRPKRRVWVCNDCLGPKQRENRQKAVGDSFLNLGKTIVVLAIGFFLYFLSLDSGVLVSEESENTASNGQTKKFPEGAKAKSFAKPSANEPNAILSNVEILDQQQSVHKQMESDLRSWQYDTYQDALENGLNLTSLENSFFELQQKYPALANRDSTLEVIQEHYANSIGEATSGGHFRPYRYPKNIWKKKINAWVLLEFKKDKSIVILDSCLTYAELEKEKCSEPAKDKLFTKVNKYRELIEKLAMESASRDKPTILLKPNPSIGFGSHREVRLYGVKRFYYYDHSRKGVVTTKTLPREV